MEFELKNMIRKREKSISEKNRIITSGESKNTSREEKLQVLGNSGNGHHPLKRDESISKEIVSQKNK